VHHLVIQNLLYTLKEKLVSFKIYLYMNVLFVSIEIYHPVFINGIIDFKHIIHEPIYHIKDHVHKHMLGSMIT